jgi:hypothetical protein
MCALILALEQDKNIHDDFVISIFKFDIFVGSALERISHLKV